MGKLDLDFSEFFDDFVLKDVKGKCSLEPKTGHLAVLATLLGSQAVTLFGAQVKEAIKAGVSPVEIKEVIYQSVAYLGIGRVADSLNIANQVMEDLGIELPLKSQSTTSAETRLEKGIEAQVTIFGPQMETFYKSGPEEKRHMNRWLAENCFGDYYTRTGLDLKQREMITFCFLSAQGGCEPQLKAHALANMRMGNDRLFLIDVVSYVLPYIGYPRTLNAMQCIEDAAELFNKQ